MTMNKNKIFVAIPVLDEYDYLPQTLHSIFSQNADIHLFICVNQPEKWWNIPDFLPICQNNQRTLEYLQSIKNQNITIIDKSSKGQGWQTQKQGVGMARKTLMDSILQVAQNDDVIISLDADTLLEKDYIENVNKRLSDPQFVALAAPYYHALSGNKQQDRAMLRYEIYMRNYLLNLMLIGSPYSFTALGSAIACKCSVCRAVGGFDVQTAGEDFYFLQKIRKFGKIALSCEKKVFPANRFSHRVPFGTGPAIEKGTNGDFAAYPIYDIAFFDEIKKTYSNINQLFEKNIASPFFIFLQQQFKSENFLQPLRKNYKTIDHFTKAFHQKVDALRIFQFLRYCQQQNPIKDEMALIHLFAKVFPNNMNVFFNEEKPFSFENSNVENLNKLRDFLVEKENIFRYKFDKQLPL